MEILAKPRATVAQDIPQALRRAAMSKLALLKL
jgi:hypothetical protein